MATIAPPTPRKDRRSRMRQVRQNGLFLVLHLGWFGATTLLLTWGMFVLFFLAIGGFSLDGLMHQLNNLASRYVAADPGRVRSFAHIVFAAHILLSGAIVFFRRHSILPHNRSARYG